MVIQRDSKHTTEEEVGDNTHSPDVDWLAVTGYVTVMSIFANFLLAQVTYSS